MRIVMTSKKKIKISVIDLGYPIKITNDYKSPLLE